MIERNHELYESLLRSMASLSGLFSQSKIPYIDSRFAEKMFVLATGARDLGRADKSFDALLPGGIGVGIKTFSAATGTHKSEKVAEFTALAREGHFRVADKQKLVRRVAEARNQRILSNVAEYGIDVDRCVYHCLVRFEGGAVVHEEPYRLIDTRNLSPLNKAGRPAPDWSFADGKIYFTDGHSKYGFSISKNVLMKRFEFSRRAGVIELAIHPNPLELLERLAGRKSAPFEELGRFTLNLTDDEEDEPGVAGRDYVVLPLYSTRSGDVPPSSGINQWNASGRARTFGEAYVPVPALIHARHPGFFPPRDTHFVLELPNGFSSHKAKICQSGGKALMTESNIELGRWLISVIDPTARPDDIGKPPRPRHRPYTYADLLTIGSDSVIVRRVSRGRYSIEFGPLGAYREFEQSA